MTNQNKGRLGKNLWIPALRMDEEGNMISSGDINQ